MIEFFIFVSIDSASKRLKYALFFFFYQLEISWQNELKKYFSSVSLRQDFFPFYLFYYLFIFFNTNFLFVQKHTFGDIKELGNGNQISTYS